MAVATDNCTQINGGGTQCQNFKRAPTSMSDCGNYDGKPAQGGRPPDPNGWVQLGGDSEDPRLVSLFVVPYQALKNVRGRASGMRHSRPSLRVLLCHELARDGMRHTAIRVRIPTSAESPPTCLGPAGNGTILGVFDKTVLYEPGPVDPNAICREDDPTPCRVSTRPMICR